MIFKNMEKKAKDNFEDLVKIMRRLREECPWDRKQTHESLRQYLLEECYEVIESVDTKRYQELAKELQSEDEQIVMVAIERLGSLKDKQATAPLIEALGDSRYMIRIHVTAQLGERKDKGAIGPLIIALGDESIFVRQTVAGALENIGGKKALDAVKKAESKGLLLDELPAGVRL